MRPTFSSTNPSIRPWNSADFVFDPPLPVSLLFEMEKAPVLPVRSTFKSRDVKTCSAFPMHQQHRKHRILHVPTSQSYALCARQQHLLFGNMVFGFILPTVILRQISSSILPARLSQSQRKQQFGSHGTKGTRLENREHRNKLSAL